MAVVFGLDISHRQDGLSLAAVQAQGYEFVIAKATEGQGVQDDHFDIFRKEAERLGLLFGAYHLLHSDSTARAQADNLLDRLGGRTDIPVMVDVEPTPGSSPTLQDTKGFIAACKKRGLRVTILYLPNFHWVALGKPKLGAGLPPLMQALYGKDERKLGSRLYPGNTSPRWDPIGGRTPVLLQFGSHGRIDGPKFKKLNVDVDAFRGTRKQLVATGMLLNTGGKKAAGKKASPARTTAPPKKAAPKKAAPKKTVPKKAAPKKTAAAKKATFVKADKTSIQWRGHKLNAKTILMLQSAERRLKQRLVITQGSFNTTVDASKGTHDQGGVLDISIKTGPPINKKLKALRRSGFAAWHRTPDQFLKKDHVPEHIHAVSLFDRNLAPNAAKQKTSFLGSPPGNGLKSGAADDGPSVPRPAKPPLVKQKVRRREILLGETNDSIGFLQDRLGLTPDRFFGSKETQPLVKKRFGWDGKKPMPEKVFRKLFPESVFKLDVSVPDKVPAAAPPTPAGLVAEPAAVAAAERVIDLEPAGQPAATPATPPAAQPAPAAP